MTDNIELMICVPGKQSNSLLDNSQCQHIKKQFQQPMELSLQRQSMELQITLCNFVSFKSQVNHETDG